MIAAAGLTLVLVLGAGPATLASVTTDDRVASSPVGWVTSGLPEGSTVHPVLEEVLEEALPGQWLRVIVQYDERDRMDPQAVEATGATVHYEAQAAPMLFVMGTPDMVRAVAGLDGVRGVHYDEPLELDLDSAVYTGRAYHVWGSPVTTLTIDDGVVIDGTGIGVAVVDTGLNGLHADLQLGKTTVRNLEAVGIPVGNPVTQGQPLDWYDHDHTDANGHGSHVGGIVAGSGELSGYRYVGSGPGAGLYGFGSNVLSLWYGVAAWDWVFQHGADQDPPVRIITNSWGYGHGPCELDHPFTLVQKRLVLEKDVLMIFSAGNAGRDSEGDERDGSENHGRTQYQCPWQGNIGVASMDDRGQRDHDGPPSAFTSRGKKEDPTTWPHISAPGSNITAPRGGTQSWAQNCAGRPDAGLDTRGCYWTISGTSMSTPFVAGVAALVLQARGDLRPADVQYILQQTAYKFGENTTYRGEKVVYNEDEDGDYRYHGGHYFRGHGLVDAAAAVAFALEYDPEEHPVVYGFDETPPPLWEYGLMANQTHGSGTLDTQESPPVGFVIWVVLGVLLLVLASRSGQQKTRNT